MELLLLNGADYSHLIELKKLQENKPPQSVLEFNSDYLENTSKFFDVLKAMASSADGDQIIIIKRKKQNKSTPDLAGTELTEPGKAAPDPAKKARVFKKSQGVLRFQCRRNKKIFVEHFLREVNKELGLFITPINEVIDIFFSKKIVPRSKKIYMDCGNPRFAYVIKILQIHFISLSVRNIARSKIFYNQSRKVITEHALYKAWSRTMYDPADVVIIDAILKKVEQICTDI